MERQTKGGVVTKTFVSRSQDPDMQGVMPALLGAAERARQIARQTGTKLVVIVDGKLVELDPDTLAPREYALQYVKAVRA